MPGGNQGSHRERDEKKNGEKWGKQGSDKESANISEAVVSNAVPDAQIETKTKKKVSGNNGGSCYKSEVYGERRLENSSHLRIARLFLGSRSPSKRCFLGRDIKQALRDMNSGLFCVTPQRRNVRAVVNDLNCPVLGTIFAGTVRGHLGCLSAGEDVTPFVTAQSGAGGKLTWIYKLTRNKKRTRTPVRMRETIRSKKLERETQFQQLERFRMDASDRFGGRRRRQGSFRTSMA